MSLNKNLVSFNFNKNKNKRVVVNDFGFYSILKEHEFGNLLKGENQSKLLVRNQFFNDRLNLDFLYAGMEKRYNLSWRGPHTHIISLTRRCQGECSYCAASCTEKGENADLKTVKKIIDFIMGIPQKELFLEFTGGEPSLNIAVLKEAAVYAKKQAAEKNKKIYFSVVTNLSYEKPEILQCFMDNNITVCSSLDGPPEIHDANRNIRGGAGTYSYVFNNLSILNSAAKKGIIESPSLISTINKKSLFREKEIVDEYLKLGINRVQLGMLEPLGRAEESPDLKITPAEYLEFYRNAVNYILWLNWKKNIFIYEKGLFLLLYEIMNFDSYSKRSVDVYNRLAYDTKGNIYPSDEGRIIGENGDETLKIGSVDETFENFIKKSEPQAFMLYALNKYLSAHCARCPYSNWCRTQVFYNYAAQNSFWGNMVTSRRCLVFKGVFDMIFELLQNRKYLKVFENWMEKG